MRDTFFIVLLVFAILNLIATVVTSMVISSITQQPKPEQSK
ncbi:hypothetical protein [Piscibacillus salipiscarius]|uniref:Uncharacterized protein n=1 Tax=Piscibacillus salipiscarius TaxID=299480 RepID=A0ABW5Q6H0_9BACI|nr:hypothetical protein [Piscibacillus salipiscarius]